MANVDEIVARAKARARAKAILSGQSTEPTTFSTTPGPGELLPQAPSVATGLGQAAQPAKPDILDVLPAVLQAGADARQIPFLRSNRTGVEDVALGMVRGGPAAIQSIGSAIQVPAALAESVIGETAMGNALRDAGGAVKRVGELGTAVMPEPNTKVGQVAQGAAPFAAAVGIGAGTGGLGGLALFAGTSAAPVVGQVFEEAKAYHEANGDKDAEGKAAIEAMTSGVVSTAINFIPAIGILGKLPGGIPAIQNAVLRTAAKVGWGALAGGSAGALQELSLDIQRTYQRGQEPIPAGELANRTAQSAIGGAVFGGAGRAMIPSGGVPRIGSKKRVDPSVKRLEAVINQKLGELGEAGVPIKDAPLDATPRALRGGGGSTESPTPIKPPVPKVVAPPSDAGPFVADSVTPKIEPNPIGVVDPTAQKPVPVSGFTEYFGESTIAEPSGPKGFVGDAPIQTEVAPIRGLGKPSKAITKTVPTGKEPFRAPAEPVSDAPFGRDFAGFVPLEAAPSETVVASRAAAKSIIGRAVERLGSIARGGMPREMFVAKIDRDNLVAAQAQRIREITTDLNTAVKASGLQRYDPNTEAVLNAVLRGEEPTTEVPAPVRSAIARARIQIDSFSKEITDRGIPTRLNAEIVFDENLGKYVTRFYEAAIDPAANKKMMESRYPDRVEKARAFLMEQRPEMTPEQLNLAMSDLYNWFNPVKQSGSLGQNSARSILKDRNENIPPEIRALWGEVTDTNRLIAETVRKQGELIATDKYHKRLVQEGVGKWLFPESEGLKVIDGVAYDTPLAPESDAYKTLQGYRTSREIAEAFRAANEATKIPGWLQPFAWGNQIAKFSKTVGNFPQGYARNFLGRPLNALANGHVNLFHPLRNFLTLWDREFPAGTEGSERRRAYIRYLIEEGIIGKSPMADDLMKSQAELSDGGMLGLRAKNFLRLVKKGMRGAATGYGSMDDVWSIAMYDSEMRRHRKAFPDMPEAELRDMVRRKHHMTAFNRDYVPEPVKSLRHTPIGPFASFWSEVIRTTGNTIKLAAEEVRDPRTRAIGLSRITGLAAAASSPFAIQLASKMMSGVSDEDERAIRDALPSFNRNSNLVFLGKNAKGHVRVVDLSYANPLSQFTDAIQATMTSLMAGDEKPTLDRVANVLGEIFGPLVDEQIFTQAVLELWANQKQGIEGPTGKIMSDQRPLDENAKAFAWHLFKAIEPGAVTQSRRILKAATGHVESNGRTYNIGDELTALAGPRILSIDPKRWVFMKGGEFRSQLQEAGYGLASIGASLGSDATNDAKILKEQSITERARKRLFKQMQGHMENAMRLGLSWEEVTALLKTAGVSQNDIYALQDGTYTMPETTGRELTGLRRKADVLGIQPVRDPSEVRDVMESGKQ